jgi:hypothetical protein
METQSNPRRRSDRAIDSGGAPCQDVMRSMFSGRRRQERRQTAIALKFRRCRASFVGSLPEIGNVAV